MSKGQTLQDPFLNSLRKDRIPVSIFLVNGIKLQGQIESFDQYEALYATRQLAKRQYTWMRKLVSTQQLVERFDIRPLATIDQARNLLIKTS